MLKFKYTSPKAVVNAKINDFIKSCVLRVHCSYTFDLKIIMIIIIMNKTCLEQGRVGVAPWL